MSTYRKNALTKSASGSFGDEFVFRQVNGRTIIVPLPRRTRKRSPKQKEVINNFLRASYYAKAAVANPVIKTEYTAIAKIKNFKGGAMVAAMTDFLTSTKLEMVYAHLFDDNIGFPITIVLADNYKGREMAVSVSNKEGMITESGTATFTFGDSAWRYVTTVAYPNLDGLKLLVTVKDRVGRVATFEKLLDG